jgi:hypothetical protein
MQKTYNEIISLNGTLAGMSRDRWPFGIILAKDIKIMDKVIMEYNEKRQAIIDKYVMRDEAGEILGVMRPVQPEHELAEGETVQMERVKNPRRIDETEWIDRAAFEKELAELNEQNAELELVPVDLDTVFFNMQANRDMKIREFIDSNMEPSLVLFLSDYGFWKNFDE